MVTNELGGAALGKMEVGHDKHHLALRLLCVERSIYKSV